MAYQRVTLSQLRTQLLALLKSSGTFWSQEEMDSAINEAISVWQLMTGETVTNLSQTITSTTSNIFDVVTNSSAGKALSVIRIAEAGASPLREMSIVELDQGYYGWRKETASSTTQRPTYWAPIGITSFAIYPRVGATSTYNLQCYAEAVPLAATGSYIDIDESYLTKVLAYAQSVLAFKQGPVDGTDNSQALKDLFLTAARERNQILMETALYKNYMGQDESKGEPAPANEQQGARG